MQFTKLSFLEVDTPRGKATRVTRLLDQAKPIRVLKECLNKYVRATTVPVLHTLTNQASSKEPPLPSVSVVICTHDRPEELGELLPHLASQTLVPTEIIVVDDSDTDSARTVVSLARHSMNAGKPILTYVHARLTGLTAARNVGLKLSTGDLVLYLDDDTIPSTDLLEGLARFMRDHPAAAGVQPTICQELDRETTSDRLRNAIYKGLMLNYLADDRLDVRRSGTSVFPRRLTSIIRAGRLSGCCCCYRHSMIRSIPFDERLQRWGYMEDLDFSVRVRKRFPGALYAIPQVNIIHNVSPKSKKYAASPVIVPHDVSKSRPPSKKHVEMATFYWFYLFFEDVWSGSVVNLISFLWALAGNMGLTIGASLITHNVSQLTPVYVISSYITAFRRLRDIRNGELGFFNEKL